MTSPVPDSSTSASLRFAHLHAVLLVPYGCFLACTQLLWLTYVPVTAQAHTDFGVSEGAVGDLSVLCLVAFVVLGIPAGRWLDRFLAPTLSLGLGLTVLGAVVRALDCQSYETALAGQSLIAAGQPFVVNAMTKLPAQLLSQRGSTRAIAALSAAQFAGMLAAVGVGGSLYRVGGLSLLVGVHAVVTVVCGVAALIAVRLLPARTVEAVPAPPAPVLRTPVLWLLGGSAFVGFGLFNATMTWLDTILTDLGRPGTAGWTGMMMILAGIAGAAVVPNVTARAGRRREALLVIACVGVLAPLVMAFVHGVVVETLLLATLGCALLAALPVILELSERALGAANAGTATGFIMLAGNLGGTVYVLVLQVLLGEVKTALVVLGILALPGVLFARRLQRTDADALLNVDGRDAAVVVPTRRPARDG